MKKLLFLFTILIFLGCSDDNKGKLVWSDEFDYTGLPDSTKWTHESGGGGWGNNELQFYTAGRKENARVENGFLIIEAIREDWDSSRYTSARLLSKGRNISINDAGWQYGRVEVRARLPKGRGTWPAIWMLPSKEGYTWPDDGEIDIMEHVGYNQGIVHGTVHCKKYNHVAGTQKGDTIAVKDCSEQYHVYSLEWNKDSITTAVDGQVFFRFANEKNYDAWPFDKKMHLLLNVAVGGNWGGAKGVDETIWPQRMEIDYVRVYQ